MMQFRLALLASPLLLSSLLSAQQYDPLTIRSVPAPAAPELNAAVAPRRADTTLSDPVIFYDSTNGSSQDANNFVWDPTNFRLGIRNNAPADALDIVNGRLRLNTGTASAEAFNLSGRVGVGFAVPYLTPTSNNSIIAFDLYPHGNPTNLNANTGVAWFDLCSTDVNLVGANYECLRMGKFANGDAHVSAVKGGTATVRNLDLQINGGRVGVGTTSPAALLSVGTSSPFQVDTSGNIVKLNNAATNFPKSNAAGYLYNDGRGNFSYVTAPPSSSRSATQLTALSGPAVVTSNSAASTGVGAVAPALGGYVLSSQPGEVPAAGVSYAAPAMAAVTQAENMRQYVVAKACRVNNLFANIGGDSALAGDITLTLRVARGSAVGADTAIAAMIPAGAHPGAVTYRAPNPVDLAEGDLVSIRVDNASAAPVHLLTVNFYCSF